MRLGGDNASGKKRETFRRKFAGILVAALSVIAARDLLAKGTVVFKSPCSCDGNHGVARWGVKTDIERPPFALNSVRRITPADISSWEGPAQKPPDLDRLPEERQWYALECRVTAVKVEEDGDLHIEVVNADGRSDRVVVEVPLGDTWCEIRKVVFACTDAEFPVKRGQFKTIEHPIVTFIGKAFYDIDHAPRDHRGNRRGQNSAVAVWEIHPVMEMRIGSRVVSSQPPNTQLSTGKESASSATPSPPNVQPAAPAEQGLATIVEPVPIKIPYGTTVLQRGMRFPIVGRDRETVRIRYMGEVYAIPLTSTDLH